MNKFKKLEPEQTLAIVKPDGVARGLIGVVIEKAESHGLSPIQIRMTTLNRATAEEFYAEHKGKEFFKPLVDFTCSGKVVIMVLEGYDAVKWWRNIMGATNSAQARPGTIRRDHWVPGAPIRENVVHGSDSPESAKREIEFFNFLW